MSEATIPFRLPSAPDRPLRPVVPSGALTRAGQGVDALAREGLWLLGLLALTRAAVLLLLYHATGGREFTDDVGVIYLPMLDAPLAILAGEASAFAHFPPLLPLFLAPAQLLRPFLPDFVALRALFAGYELLAWPLVWLVLCRTVRGTAPRRLLGLAYIASPMTWITSVVMCQDEVVSLVFAAGIVAALATERRWPALVLCSLAVCAAKVFFLVPLAALILAPSGSARLRGLAARAALALGPIGLVYGLASLARWTGERGVAIAGFDPPIMFCIGLWTALSQLEPLPTRVMELASAALASVGIGGVLWLARVHRVSLSGADLARLAGALLLCLFATFYHVNPEYYVLAVPPVLLLFRPVWSAFVLLVGFALPWAVNFVYGVSAAGPGTPAGKQTFVDAYRSLVVIDPTLLHAVLLWVCATAMLALAVTAARALGPSCTRRAGPLPLGTRSLAGPPVLPAEGYAPAR